MNMFLSVSAVLTFGTLYLIYLKSGSKKEKQQNIILRVPPGKVLFFTKSNAYCRKYCLTKKKRKPCGTDCSLGKLNYLIQLIDKAKSTIDVCIYLITCNELAYAIIRAHSRRIRVRIIIDEEMSSCSGSKTSLFINAGIPVKSKRTDCLMHHKFCVIDYALPERMLITGSLNWTLQGLAGNFEYVSIIFQPEPVMQYQKEFNLLWNEFSFK